MYGVNFIIGEPQAGKLVLELTPTAGDVELAIADKLVLELTPLIVDVAFSLRDDAADDLHLSLTPIVREVNVEIDEVPSAELKLNLAAFFKGDKGAPGSSNLVVTAPNNIGGNRLVYIQDGLLMYASNQVLVHSMKVVGLTAHAANVGDTLTIVLIGEIEEPGWNWDLSKPIFLGINGLPTQVDPSTTGAKFSLVVGFPLSSTKMYVSLREPVAFGD